MCVVDVWFPVVGGGCLRRPVARLGPPLVPWLVVLWVPGRVRFWGFVEDAFPASLCAVFWTWLCAAFKSRLTSTVGLLLA